MAYSLQLLNPDRSVAWTGACSSDHVAMLQELGLLGLMRSPHGTGCQIAKRLHAAIMQLEAPGSSRLANWAQSERAVLIRWLTGFLHVCVSHPDATLTD